MEKICRRVVIEGRVQGVMFRASCAQMAERENVAGFARNLLDGNVEVELEGDADAVEKVLSWCKQGPPAARVNDVKIHIIPPRNHRNFSVL